MSYTPITIPGNSPSLVPNRRYWPVVTLVILGINFVVFLIMTFKGGSTNTDVLLDFGASFNPYFRRGEYWRLVMPMFLHIGWLHLIVNSYALSSSAPSWSEFTVMGVLRCCTLPPAWAARPFP